MPAAQGLEGPGGRGAGGPSPAETAYDARPLNPQRLAAVMRHLHASHLDVGCGNGGYIRELAASARAVGIDWTVSPSWSKAPGRFVAGSAEALPFADRSFDSVSCFETLEHLSNPEDALVEMSRVARETLILTVPNCEITAGQRASNLIYHHWVDPTHRNFWTYDEFVSFVEQPDWVLTEAVRINDIDIVPLLVEAFAPSRLRAFASPRLLRRLSTRAYGMTTLVVAKRSAVTDNRHASTR